MGICPQICALIRCKILICINNKKKQISLVIHCVTVHVQWRAEWTVLSGEIFWSPMASRIHLDTVECNITVHFTVYMTLKRDYMYKGSRIVTCKKRTETFANQTVPSKKRKLPISKRPIPCNTCNNVVWVAHSV